MIIRLLLRKGHLASRRGFSNATLFLKNVSPGGYVLLTVPTATFALGTWQVKRRSWKMNLIAELEEKTLAPTVDFPLDLDELSKLEYQKVCVRGTFDHSKEVYIGPRSLISENDQSKGGMLSSSPRSGSLVVTPFHLADRDITILVNRGWVPKQKISQDKRAEGQIEGEIELTGVVRLGENRPVFCPKSGSKGKNFFLFRDVQAMAELCGTEPIFLEADYRSSFPGGPIGGQTRVSFRNEHLSYILTWYSLSALTSWLWYKKFIRGK